MNGPFRGRAAFRALFFLPVILSFVAIGLLWNYSAFVALLTIPVQIYIIPLYVLIVRAHLSNSLLGLILPYTAGSLPLAIFLLKTYFDQLPSELMDAARLDGCDNRMILLKVVLPLSRPSYQP